MSLAHGCLMVFVYLHSISISDISANRIFDDIWICLNMFEHVWNILKVCMHSDSDRLRLFEFIGTQFSCTVRLCKGFWFYSNLSWNSSKSVKFKVTWLQVLALTSLTARVDWNIGDYRRMSLSWDVVFPFIPVYLMASLARDGMLVARVLFRAAAGCMPAAAGCVPAAAVAAAPCKASTMSTPNQASTTAKHLNVPNEIYMLPGNLANKKAMTCHDSFNVFWCFLFSSDLKYFGYFMDLHMIFMVFLKIIGYRFLLWLEFWFPCQVHLFKQCGGRPSEMVTFDVCKHCQRKSEKTDWRCAL